MELPKNTTQIGEIRGDYRIFIEDYVISYMKQLCRQEPDRKKRVALYGTIKCEGQMQYYFIYGGSEVTFAGREDDRLNERELEEMTWNISEFFQDYMLLGFVNLEEMLPEGIYLFVGGREHFVQGYHIFYEKNESMLSFLVHRHSVDNAKNEQEVTQDEPQVQVPERKEVMASVARKRLESPAEPKWLEFVKDAAVFCLVVLCIVAVSSINSGDKLQGLQSFFEEGVQAISEKKLPDREELPVSVQDVSAADEEEVTVFSMAEEPPSTLQEVEEPQESLADESPKFTPGEETTEITTDVVATQGPATIPEKQETVHVIRRGETLLQISKTYYGETNHVKQICERNGIENPDNIQIGQKIILP